MKKQLTQIALTLASTITLTGAAHATTYPGGEIVRNKDTGAYYMIYHSPGTNYTPQYKRYIGSPDVLSFYTKQLGLTQVPQVTNQDLAGTSDHPHGVNLPCGEFARDRSTGKLYVSQPHFVEGDQSSTNFAYSDGFFADYIGGIPPQSLYLGTVVANAKPTAMNIAANWAGSFDNLYSDIPMCTIVRQTGTQDYYRIAGVSRAFDTSYPRNERYTFTKSKIGNVELLNQWLHFNTFSITADLTSLTSSTNARMVPGQLVRTVADPTVYFVNDEGTKDVIPTIQAFYGLGFSVKDVKFYSQATLDSTPTSNHVL